MTNGTGVWWTDGHRDPWRDPETETALVLPSAPAGATSPPVEPVPDPATPAGAGAWSRGAPTVLVTALVVALIAGGLGGALGYRFADQDGVSLGAEDQTATAALAQRPPESLARVADEVLPSVVTVRAGGQVGSHIGSGFVVSPEGYVVTNDHVVGDAGSSPTVTFHDGEQEEATLVGRAPESDIAVLQVDREQVTTATLGDASSVAVGDPVLAFGSPLALANTVTSGIVSAVDRPLRSGRPGEQVRYYAAIQTDAAVNQGNSGGPLVDAAGRVVGVNSVIKSLAASADQAANIGLAFAIPIDQAGRIAEEIIDRGEARRTIVGVKLDRSGSAVHDGVRAGAVPPGGPAHEAGLRSGDVLLRLDGQPLDEPADLVALVRKHAPGETVALTYRRGAAEHSAEVTLAADGG